MCGIAAKHLMAILLGGGIALVCLFSGIILTNWRVPSFFLFGRSQPPKVFNHKLVSVPTSQTIS